MKVLIVVERGPIQRYLVNLCGKQVVKAVKDLTNGGKYSQAAALAFTRGSIEKVVFDDEVPTLGADLILSRNTASWDLTK